MGYNCSDCKFLDWSQKNSDGTYPCAKRNVDVSISSSACWDFEKAE